MARRVSELKGQQKLEWEQFLRDFHAGKLRHHSRAFLFAHVKARLGLTFSRDRFSRYLKKQNG